MRPWIALGLFLSLPSLATPSIGFIAFGDWGTGTNAQRQTALGLKELCQKNRCDFALTLGDNFYPSGVKDIHDSQWQEKFEAVFGPLNLVFYASLGNHDYEGSIDAQIAYTAISPLWKMPSRYYAFRDGIAEFFAIDTEKLDEPQLDWLRQGLKASTARWKFVFGHHPIVSGGMHGDTPRLKRQLLPILRDWADVYLCGHDHDRQVLRQQHPPLLIVSGAAAQTRSVQAAPDSLFASDHLGFVHIAVSDLDLRIQMLRSDGKTKDFTLIHPKR